MSGRSMTVSDFRRYVARLRKDLVGADGAIVRGIHSGCVRAVGALHESTDRAMPASPNGVVGAVNTGDYKRRWQFELLPRGGRVYNDHPAARVIEYGRRKGAKPPPVQAIKVWARRRLGLSDDEALRAAFAMRTAISRRGLVGRRVLTNPMVTDKITRLLGEEIHREVRAALERGRRG